MDNYEYTPQELKIIIDIANKRKIPISIGDNSITIHSKIDLEPLLRFSTYGFSLFVGFGYYKLDYYEEIAKYSKIFMQDKVAF